MLRGNSLEIRESRAFYGAKLTGKVIDAKEILDRWPTASLEELRLPSLGEKAMKESFECL